MKATEKKLLKYFSRLPAEQKQTLLEFAEFLAQKFDNSVSENEIQQPVRLERPAEESVVAAIKRLTASYPMLNRDKLFNETSTLMTRHVMQGQEAQLVIDELELLFERHYQELIAERTDENE